MLIRKSMHAACLLAVAAACGKKSSNSEGGATDPNADPEASNPLALLVPEGISIPAFPTTSTGALTSFSLEDSEVKDPDAEKSFGKRVEEQRKIQKGETDKCINPDVFRDYKTDNITCYEFDSDMNPAQFADSQHTFGTTDGKHSTGEACMVAFARKEMLDVKGLVDRSMALFNGVVCQAKKAGKTEPPAIGRSTNLTELLESAGKDGGLKITSATVTRDTETKFTTEISITDPKGRTMSTVIVNDALEGGDEGVISITRGPGTPKENTDVDPNNTVNKNFLLSIVYKQDKDANVLKAELRHAAIEKSQTQFNADRTVALESLDDNAANSIVHAIKYVSFDMNTETNAGNLSYWMNPGGSKVESARGFTFSLKDESGELKGCGVSGATRNVSVRLHLSDAEKAKNEYALKPVRYWHPRGTQNIHPNRNTTDFGAQEGSTITRQCFKLDKNLGYYVIDTAEIADAKGYSVITAEANKIEPPAKPK